eukprot:761350-Hanusia_phi.AAC.1
MGAIPITSRFLDSALNETAGIFDLGPPAQPGLIGKNPEWLQQWIDAVVEASNHAERYSVRRRLRRLPGTDQADRSTGSA